MSTSKPTDRVPLPYPQQRPLDTVQVGDHTPEPKRSTGEGWVCRCHERMGNDFYFLPHDRCLYDHCDREERERAEHMADAARYGTELHEKIEQRYPRASESVIGAPRGTITKDPTYGAYHVPAPLPEGTMVTGCIVEPKYGRMIDKDDAQLQAYALGAAVHEKVAEVTVRGMALFNHEVKQALDEIERWTDPALDIERDLS